MDGAIGPLKILGPTSGGCSASGLRPQAGFSPSASRAAEITLSDPQEFPLPGLSEDEWLVGVLVRVRAHCCLVSGVLEDHLSHLVANLLPVADKVPRLIVSHYRGALLFEDEQHCFRASAPATILIAGDLPERSRYPVELDGNTPLDEDGPLNLAACAAGVHDVFAHLK